MDQTGTPLGSYDSVPWARKEWGEKKKSVRDTGEILNPSNRIGNGKIEKEGKKNQNSNPRGWCAVVIS